MKNVINNDEDLLGFCYLFILEKMRQRRYQQDCSETPSGNSQKDEVFRGEIIIDKEMDFPIVNPLRVSKP